MAEETKKQKKLHFFCHACSIYWRHDDCTDAEGDSYFSICPACESRTENVPHQYANLKKMSCNATGPRSKEGKDRSSMNAFKTGLSSKRSGLLAPALHGKFAECKLCEHTEECKEKKLKWCPVNTSLLLKFMTAYENNDSTEIKRISGLMQGRVMVVLQQMFNSVFTEGAAIWEEHKDYTELKAHPLLKHIKNMMELAGSTAEQMKMTPKSQDDGNNIPGGLILNVDVNDFAESLKQKILAGSQNLAKADEERAKDTVLSNLNEEDAQGEAEMQLPTKNVFGGSKPPAKK